VWVAACTLFPSRHGRWTANGCHCPGLVGHETIKPCVPVSFAMASRWFLNRIQFTPVFPLSPMPQTPARPFDPDRRSFVERMHPLPRFFLVGLPTVALRQIAPFFRTPKARRNLEFIQAAGQLNLAKLQQLAPFVDPNARDAAGDTALMRAAAQSGGLECVKFLLSFSDAKAHNHEGWTALMFSVRDAEKLAITELLLPHSDPRALNRHQENALVLALQLSENPISTVEMLFPVSDANSVNCIGSSLLSIATAHVSRHGATTLAYLARHLKDTPHRATGRTALMLAAENHSIEALRILLPVSNPKAQTTDNETALMRALKDTKEAAACVAFLAPFSDLKACVSLPGQFPRRTVIDYAFGMKTTHCANALLDAMPDQDLLLHRKRVEQKTSPRAFARLEAFALQAIVSKERRRSVKGSFDEPRPSVKSDSETLGSATAPRRSKRL